MIVPVFISLNLLGFMREGIVGNATKLGIVVGWSKSYLEITDVEFVL